MGQAFGRAARRLRNTNTSIDPSSSSSSRYQNPNVPYDRVNIYKNDPVVEKGGSNAVKSGGVSEEQERDPKFEAMLSQMVGRISTKPGGKQEMGEDFVVQKSKRPMPKERNTTDSGRYEDRPVAAGTLNVAQLRHILLLYQGKADDHNGPMSLKEIADTFRVDAAKLERILQSVSLLPEDNTSKKRPDV